VNNSVTLDEENKRLVDRVSRMMERHEELINANRNEMLVELEGLEEEGEELEREINHFMEGTIEWESELKEIMEDESSVVDKKQEEEEEEEATLKSRNNHLNDERREREIKIGKINRWMATNGGRTGGWPPRDHDVFLRVLTQNERGRGGGGFDEEMIVSKIHKLIIMRERGEIEDHLIWYKEFLNQEAQKKEIVNSWKRGVHEGRRRAEREEEEEEEGDMEMNEETLEELTNQKRRNDHRERERRRKREEVKEWKKLKEEEKEKDEEEKEIEEIIRMEEEQRKVF